MPCPASACVHGEEEWGKDEPREKFRTAIADSGKPSMKAKPPHHSGNMKALFFFAPCWWGSADERENFKHKLRRKTIKAEKMVMVMVMVRNQREEKKFVSCKLQPETEAVTIACISSTRPCKRRPKTTFPDQSIQCLCLSHMPILKFHQTAHFS